MEFNETMYMVNETDERVELCVIVGVPEDQNIGDVTFNLAVETKNGTASTSKIPELIKFWMEILHFRTTASLQLSLLPSLPMVTTDVQHTHTPAHTYTKQYTVGSGTIGSGMMDSGYGAEYDYMSVMTTLATFTMEQPTQCFNVTIIDDSEVETTEHFFVRLNLTSVTTIDSNRITVAPEQTTVNIMDNDGCKLWQDYL